MLHQEVPLHSSRPTPRPRPLPLPLSLSWPIQFNSCCRDTSATSTITSTAYISAPSLSLDVVHLCFFFKVAGKKEKEIIIQWEREREIEERPYGQSFSNWSVSTKQSPMPFWQKCKLTKQRGGVNIFTSIFYIDILKFASKKKYKRTKILVKRLVFCHEWDNVFNQI